MPCCAMPRRVAAPYRAVPRRPPAAPRGRPTASEAGVPRAARLALRGEDEAFEKYRMESGHDARSSRAIHLVHS